MAKRGPFLSVVVVATALVALAACGGSGGKKSASKETTTTAAAATNNNAAEGTTAAAGTTRTVGKKGSFNGFGITVDTVKTIPGFGTNVGLEVDLTYENLGTDATSAPRTGHLLLEGAILQAQVDDVQIPGGGKAQGTMKTDVDLGNKTADAVLDRITLVYGEATDNQTIIPFDTKAQVQSVEPQTIAVSGQLKQKQILIDLVKGSTTPSYASGDKGKGLLAVQFKLSCTPDCQASGYAVERAAFSVKTPDGQSLAAADSSPFCCEALYPGNTFEGPKEVVQFKLPLPIKGTYTLTFADNALVTQGNPGSSAPITVA